MHFLVIREDIRHTLIIQAKALIKIKGEFTYMQFPKGVII
jgi:hypothetical protein